MTTLEKIALIKELNTNIGLENSGRKVYLLAPSPEKEAVKYVNFLHSKGVFSDELIDHNISVYAQKTSTEIMEVDIYLIENYETRPVVSLFDETNP